MSKYIDPYLNFAEEDIPGANYMPQAEEDSFNPFDKGVEKAMAAARQMIDMSSNQRGEAFAKSIATFNKNLGDKPARGFWGNVGRFANAFAPAYDTYTAEEKAAQALNQKDMQMIQQYTDKQKQIKAGAEEKAWNKKFKEKQLAAQERRNVSQEAYQAAKLNKMSKLTPTEEKELIRSKQEEHEAKKMAQALDYAQDEIIKIGNKGERKAVNRIIDNYIPGGKPLTDEQQRVDTIGKLVKDSLGVLYNATTNERFKSLPVPGVDKSMKANWEAIEDTRRFLGLPPKEFPVGLYDAQTKKKLKLYSDE